MGRLKLAVPETAGRALRLVEEICAMAVDTSPNSPTAPDYGASFPVLPLREGVLFPFASVPYEIGRAKTVALAQHVAGKPGSLIVVFAQRESKVDEPGETDLHDVGTLARVDMVQKQKGGTYGMVVTGLSRVKLEAIESTTPFLQARVRPLEEAAPVEDDELAALGLALRDAAAKLVEALPRVPRDIMTAFQVFRSPGQLGDLIATYLEAPVSDKIELLGQLDAKERVRKLLALINRRIEVQRMREEINSHVKSDFDKAQREHLLRQQMKAIQDELGENGGDESDALEDLEKRVAEAKLSPEAAEVARKQLKRLKDMSPQSPEATTVRSYLEWILDLPWVATAHEEPEIAAVRAVLDADHYGLEKVKKRILEYLAVRKLKLGASAANDGGVVKTKSPILCLIGPPGVGKTSLGKSIARAMGREFVRVSLGGVHDEAQIRGHRRTYIGALPGNIIQGMKKAGTTAPVFMLDEVDKLGSDFRGDPSSALLEVLDPEQNGTFADHYLEIPYDLSNVVFVATANVGDTIPAPLRDRMEIIEIAGYTRAEKLAIARRYLVPKQLREHGLAPEQLEITDEALGIVIERYTREAGVRSLERKIAALVRGVAVQVAEGKAGEGVVLRTEEDLRPALGAAPFTDEVAERTDDPGVATGLAWTPVGGAILFIEAAKMPGKGKLTLTGQLGDVMKESALAALSYVRANADRFGIPQRALDESDVHVHVPAGAMPKDGPSAGVTMLSALVSLFTGIRVRHDVAMTGEITLRGRVLPIGGLKEKVLAAHRAGIKRVIVPERNRADLDEVPADVKRDIDFVFARRMDEVIEAALEHEPVARRQAPQAAPVAA
ncbi:MAG TPA: endopeptidase La [Polyangiaceae bacterium]